MATTEQIDDAVRVRTASPADTRLEWLPAAKEPTGDEKVPFADDMKVARRVSKWFHDNDGRIGGECRVWGDEDCQDIMRALGFRPYLAAKTVDSTGRRRAETKTYGRCPVCRRRAAVKKAGVMGAHFANDMEREHCDGENERPVAEEPA